jgi:hypothetical protein
MFGLFKKKDKSKKSVVAFVDINGDQLAEGDVVMSFRYDLGKCVIVSGPDGFAYESLKTKKRVNWTLMIDAVNERQKVEKLRE